MNHVLALHGGAGTLLRGGDEAPYHAALRAALTAGDAVLRAGGCALDAVVAAVVALEDCPLFNAGLGAVFNADGRHELDAGVMEGTNLRAGAVAAVGNVRNPVRAARAVLEDGRAVLLAGAGAERFAVEAGLVPVPNAHFSTPRRRAQLEAMRASRPDAAVLDHDGEAAMRGTGQALRVGTVGAVALDARGALAAATSTGGMTNKRAGRVGDSPVPGAGVYANDASCAVSATGTGEHFLRGCVGHEVHARMVHGGRTLQVAAAETLHDVIGRLGGAGGFIALSRDGTLAMPFNTPGMYRGWVRRGEAAATAIF